MFRRRSERLRDAGRLGQALSNLMSNAIQYWDASKPVTATIAGRGRQQMWGSGRQLCNHASTTALSAMKKLTVIAAVARARRLGVDCDGGASVEDERPGSDDEFPTGLARKRLGAVWDIGILQRGQFIP
jgi:hypothetical protein